MLSLVAHLTEPVGGCGGGPMYNHAAHYLQHLCQQLQLRDNHFVTTVCEHVCIAGCWPSFIAAVSADCLNPCNTAVIMEVR
jgi:hypothetical protein